jgi:hypothetical protein
MDTKNNRPQLPIKLIEKTEGFALWEVIYKGRIFLWPEAIKPWLGKETGPSVEEAEGHYNFKLWKEERDKNVKMAESTKI